MFEVVYECSHCKDYTSSWLFAFNNHVKHCKKFFIQFYCENVLEVYRCGKCGFETFLKVDYDNHINWKHNCINVVCETGLKEHEEFRCDRCDFSTFSKYCFKVHLSKISCWTTQSRDGRIKCKQCDKIFKMGRSIKVHLFREHPDFVCLKTVKHIRFTHCDSVNLFKCEHCPYKSIQKGHLQSHVLFLHSDPAKIQWLSCELCSYKCKVRSHLTRHRKNIHTPSNQIKWYECYQCGYKTKYKNHLIDHMRRHVPIQENKVFRCDKCSYKTYREINLRNHSYFHIAKWLQCAHCEYKTRQNCDLKKHYNSKHADPENVKWYECTKCGFKYKTKSGLYKHLQRIHKKDK